jgi:hypothetical protein
MLVFGFVTLGWILGNGSNFFVFFIFLICKDANKSDEFTNKDFIILNSVFRRPLPN